MEAKAENGVPQIYEKLRLVMSDVGSIGKGHKNAQQGYVFRGIDDVYNAVQPALIKHGVIVSPTVVDMQREERTTKSGTALVYTTVRVNYAFAAAGDGSSVSVTTIGEGMDSGDKSANKAMSAAYKYALFQTLCIPTEGGSIDSERDSHEVAPKGGKAAAPASTQAKPDYKQWLGKMQKAREYLGDDAYYAAIAKYGREHANEFRGADEMRAVLDDLHALAKKQKQAEAGKEKAA